MKRKLKKYGLTNLKLNDYDRLTIAACPFCGSVEALTLQNTHRASYWVECEEDEGGCGAQVGGKSYGNDRQSDELTPLQHHLAKKSALQAWNRRPETKPKLTEFQRNELSG